MMADNFLAELNNIRDFQSFFRYNKCLTAGVLIAKVLEADHRCRPMLFDFLMPHQGWIMRVFCQVFIAIFGDQHLIFQLD